MEGRGVFLIDAGVPGPWLGHAMQNTVVLTRGRVPGLSMGVNYAFLLCMF